MQGISEMKVLTEMFSTLDPDGFRGVMEEAFLDLIQVEHLSFRQIN